MPDAARLDDLVDIRLHLWDGLALDGISVPEPALHEVVALVCLGDFLVGYLEYTVHRLRRWNREGDWPLLAWAQSRYRSVAPRKFLVKCRLVGNLAVCHRVVAEEDVLVGVRPRCLVFLEKIPFRAHIERAWNAVLLEKRKDVLRLRRAAVVEREVERRLLPVRPRAGRDGRRTFRRLVRHRHGRDERDNGEKRVHGLLRGAKDHVLVVSVGVVALEIDGPWHKLVRIDRAAGYADDRCVLDDGDAVEDDGEMALV